MLGHNNHSQSLYNPPQDLTAVRPKNKIKPQIANDQRMIFDRAATYRSRHEKTENFDTSRLDKR